MSLRDALDRHPIVKAGLKHMLRPFRTVSSGNYESLAETDRERIAADLKNAWRDKSIPAQQRVGVERALHEFRSGRQMHEFDVLIDMLRPLAAASPGAKLLEVGCSSGYFADVLAARGIDFRYTGCDFSEHFVEQAHRCNPDLQFDVEDATGLTYGEGVFHTVVSGCCLLHISEYARAIAETARVCSRYAVFHRTPVLAKHATRYFTKKAYGVQTLEIHFNERELVALMAQCGLPVIGIESISTDWRDGDAFAIKTYLCEKKVR